MVKYIFILILFVSCNGVQKKDSVTNSSQNIIAKDTVITYSLEGVSTEGAEVKVNYQSSKIFKSETIIYGEIGKSIIYYDFMPQKIKVTEKQYSYNESLENVKSDDDIEFTKEQTYYIDYSGNVIGNPVEDRIDIFLEFKNEIPFTIE